MAQAVSETRFPLPNIDALLSAHVRQGVGAALAETRASVVFEVAPAGTWTVVLDEGRIRLRRGGARNPQTVVRVDPRTFAGILEGAYVIVQQQERANTGEIVVALLGDEATVKYFHPRRGHIELVAANEKYEPIVVGADSSFSIIGIVKGVIRTIGK